MALAARARATQSRPVTSSASQASISKQSSRFFAGASPVFAKHVQTSRRPRPSGGLLIYNFKFLKNLGLKKPDFLPDFGKEKRKVVLDSVWGNMDRGTWEELLAEDFFIQEGGDASRFGKADYIKLVFDVILPSLPDFNWAHATDGTADKEGYSIVTLQANGHHTGAPFSLGPNFPPVEASGKHFTAAQETMRVKVEDGKVKEVLVLPVKGAGPLALYEALGGKMKAPADKL